MAARLAGGFGAKTAVYKGDGRLFGSYSSVVTQKVVSTATVTIASIADVKNDQGRQVRLTFGHGAYDHLGSGIPITGHQVYGRAIVSGAFVAPSATALRVATPSAVLLASWDYISTVPATTEDTCQLTVPTLADSNASGFHRAVLFVNECRFPLLTPGGTVGVSDAGLLAFALETPASPPRGWRLSVSFTLPVADRADLELLDVSGRRVAGREVVGAGRHKVAMDGESACRRGSTSRV